jgi:hypothetical protein
MPALSRFKVARWGTCHEGYAEAPGKLRDDAAECAVTSGLVTDKEKRDLFAKLAAHLTVLADELERVMKATKH